MGLTIQGVKPMSAAALACAATETKTTEVVIKRPDEVVYRTTETKETGWSDTFLSVLDKTASILAGLGKVVNLPFPNLAEIFNS